jgi:aryl-alcohol dehydrogenase-like predicted oxidoreductase
MIALVTRPSGGGGMESRNLGRGRLSVPVVGLGTWRRLEAAAAAGRQGELVEAAIAAGIRVIDTSPMYGEAERLLSGALEGRREQVFVADKVWTASAADGAAQLSRDGRRTCRCSRPPATAAWSA